jgi:hypothetical protein
MNCPTCNERVEPFRAECECCGQDIDWSAAIGDHDRTDEPLPPTETRGLDGIQRAVSHASVFLLGWLLAVLTVDTTLPESAAWQAPLETALAVDAWDVYAPAVAEVAVPGLVLALLVFGVDLAAQRRGFA